jgi:anaerobic dimethyl sulfoxide reductase subunit B (iron-sulfur subunit)
LLIERFVWAGTIAVHASRLARMPPHSSGLKQAPGCNFCIDRWAEGKKPACVQSCPTWALDAGPMDELRARYGDVRDADSFVYDDELIPSIIFKPKRDARDLAVRKIKTKP